MQVSDFLMLQSLMKEPFIPHPHAAIPGGVRAADVNAILLVLKKVSIGERSESMMSGEGPAFHNILFHLASGEDAELRPPPRKDEDESARIFSANLRKHAKSNYGEDWAKERSRRKHDAARLHDWLSVPYDISRLALDGEARDAAKRRRAAATALAAAPDGGDPAPNPTELERAQRRADVAWVLACGTHARGGRLCPFRQLGAGHSDLLRFIADASVVDNPAWLPRPQPRELPALRKLTWQQELQLYAERDVSEQRRLLNVELAARCQRLERLLETSERLVEAERALHAADIADADVRHKRELRKVRAEWAEKLRELKGEYRGLLGEMLEHAEEADTTKTEAVRATVAELREYQAQMKEERDAAAKQAEELTFRVADLTESLERVRCTSKAGLLSQVEELLLRSSALTSSLPLMRRERSWPRRSSCCASAPSAR